jgi:hypothetical protein
MINEEIICDNDNDNDEVFVKKNKKQNKKQNKKIQIQKLIEESDIKIACDLFNLSVPERECIKTNIK